MSGSQEKLFDIDQGENNENKNDIAQLLQQQPNGSNNQQYFNVQNTQQVNKMDIQQPQQAINVQQNNQNNEIRQVQAIVQSQKSNSQEIQIENNVLQIKKVQIQQKNINQDGYINRLEVLLNRTKNELFQTSKSLKLSEQQNKRTKQTLKKMRFDFLSSKQQISTLLQQKQHIQKKNVSLTQANQQLQQKIQTYKSAGDINQFKNKIKELEKLIILQKQELQMKSHMIDQNVENKFAEQKLQNKVDVLRFLEDYSKHNTELKAQNQQAILNQIRLNQLIVSLTEQNKNLKQTIQKLKIILKESTQKIQQLQQKLQQSSKEFQKQLIQQQNSTLSQIPTNNSNFSSINTLQTNKTVEQRYGIMILSHQQQRDVILKEFIELELKYDNTCQELYNLRERHYNSLKELRKMSVTHIHKKQFNQLYKRYSKLKLCLESSLSSQQNLKAQLRTYQNHQGQQNQFIQNIQSLNANQINQNKFRSLILQQPQNPIHQIEGVLDKNIQGHKNLQSLKQKLQTRQKLIKNEIELKQQGQVIKKLKNQVNRLNDMINIYDQQQIHKCTQLEHLEKTIWQNEQKINYLQKTTISKQQNFQLLSEIKDRRISNQILETKNIQIIKECFVLRSEKNMINQLYNNLKIMYEELFNNQRQTTKTVQSSATEKDNIQMAQVVSQHCKKCQQNQANITIIKKVEVQSQTEGLAQIYYGQVKQLLKILRKFPKKIDMVTSMLESEKSLIVQVKKKYDQAIQLNTVKTKNLQEEKKSNDQWRSKQRQDIIQEFQQIRELLINERLIAALRKAKSLIQYYQQEAAQNPVENLQLEAQIKALQEELNICQEKPENGIEVQKNEEIQKMDIQKLNDQ